MIYITIAIKNWLFQARFKKSLAALMLLAKEFLEILLTILSIFRLGKINVNFPLRLLGELLFTKREFTFVGA